MSLDLLILGSGSALPTLTSNQSAQILEADQELYLIDCGEGTQVELRRNKVRMQRINHIFISHLHGDHFFGLVGLMSTLHLLGRKKAIHIYGPKGLDEIILIQFRNAGSHLNFKMHFHIINEAGECLLEDRKLRVKALPLKHRIECYGFLFEEQEGLRKLRVEMLQKYAIPKHKRKALTLGEDYVSDEGQVVKNELITDNPPRPRSYAYCSDTAYHEALLPYIKGVDLLYHESTFMEADRERAKQTFHSTAKDAAKIAEKAGVSKLLLGHFSNRYKNTDQLLAEAKAVFENSFIAEEGKTFKV